MSDILLQFTLFLFQEATNKAVMLVKCLMKFTKVSTLCHKTLGLPSLTILVLFFFCNIDVISKCKIKPWKHATETVEIHLYLGAHNVLAMPEIMQKKAQKSIFLYVEALKLH
jgi:hypothetical protein